MTPHSIIFRFFLPFSHLLSSLGYLSHLDFWGHFFSVITDNFLNSPRPLGAFVMSHLTEIQSQSNPLYAFSFFVFDQLEKHPTGKTVDLEGAPWCQSILNVSQVNPWSAFPHWLFQTSFSFPQMANFPISLSTFNTCPHFMGEQMLLDKNPSKPCYQTHQYHPICICLSFFLPVTWRNSFSS